MIAVRPLSVDEVSGRVVISLGSWSKLRGGRVVGRSGGCKFNRSI